MYHHWEASYFGTDSPSVLYISSVMSDTHSELDSLQMVVKVMGILFPEQYVGFSAFHGVTYQPMFQIWCTSQVLFSNPSIASGVDNHEKRAQNQHCHPVSIYRVPKKAHLHIHPQVYRKKHILGQPPPHLSNSMDCSSSENTANPSGEIQTQIFSGREKAERKTPAAN